ncbi:MAG TPA: hypothetical protein VJ714_11525, partial [Anaerolineae bacterium]|nr:hypothetical protein [Anaerolineae bacterium]
SSMAKVLIRARSPRAVKLATRVFGLVAGSGPEAGQPTGVWWGDLQQPWSLLAGQDSGQPDAGLLAG